jgi:hypothetical protein
VPHPLEGLLLRPVMFHVAISAKNLEILVPFSAESLVGSVMDLQPFTASASLTTEIGSYEAPCPTLVPFLRIEISLIVIAESGHRSKVKKSARLSFFE